MSGIALSVVDIDPFIHGDAAARQRVARAFGHGFETTGFAVIVGHGIPETLARDTYDAMKAFFTLPSADKLACTPAEKTKGRGYLPMGIESVAKTLAGETPPDLCEALVFTAPHRTGQPNIWPDRPPALRALVDAWCSAIAGLTDQLSRLSALALDLPEDYFRPWMDDPALVLRFVHYPDQPVPPAAGQLRYGAHHDYGGLTILRQDSAPGGLQICDRDGEWREAVVVPDSFVINVGDLMARWTNDRWRSTLHRVSNPDRQLTGSTARLSMVAFTGPNEDSMVACLPSCQSAANPARYQPVRAGDYVRAKLTSSMAITPPA
jgi:isopenicillin N synthase-like dioxygenase